MKYHKQLTLLFLLGTGLATAFALGPQELVQVSIYNETGRALKYVFASPSGSDYWGPDLLGNRNLGFGQMLTFLLHFQGDHAYFDFLAVDEANNSYLLPGRCFYDQEKQGLVIFGIKDHKGQLPPQALCRVYVSNASNRVFSLVFLSAEDSQDWGFDLLSDSATLLPGASISFSLPCGERKTMFELYAMAEDSSYCRKRVPISREHTELFVDLLNTDLH